MNKKLQLVIALALIFQSFNISAQSNDEAAVKDVINKLFKGMELGDSAMVHSTFYKINSTFATVSKDKQGSPVLHTESSIQEFLNAVGSGHKEVWHEEIWNVKVQLDGEFAQAWCDYAFYADKTYSHCGVDAFHLIKGKNGWKIFHLADTRRKTGCAIPKEVEAKYK